MLSQPQDQAAAGSPDLCGHQPDSSGARLLRRWFLQRFSGSFWVSAALLFGFLTLDEAVRLFDVMLKKGVPPAQVIRMLVLLMPEYLSFALPLGFFFGILLAFRTLSQGRELDALRAAGLSHGQMVRPFLRLAIILTLVESVLVGFIRPLSEYHFQKLAYQAEWHSFGSDLGSGRFVTDNKDFTLRFAHFDRVRQQGDGAFFYLCAERACQVATARRGAVARADDSGFLLVTLENGRAMTVPSFAPGVKTVPGYDFANLTVRIALPHLPAFRRRQAGGREATTIELIRKLGKPHPAADMHKPVAYLLEQLLLVLFVPLVPFAGILFGVSQGRRPRLLWPAMGTVLVVGYVEAIQYLTSFAAHQAVQPAMLPVCYLAFAAIIMTGFLGLDSRVPRVRRRKPPLHAPLLESIGKHVIKVMALPAGHGRCILDRMLERRLLLTGGAMIILAMTIVAVVDLLIHLSALLADRHHLFSRALAFLLLRVPDHVVQTLPVAALVSVLVLRLSMERSRELTVMWASGFSPWQFARPLLRVSLALALIGLVVVGWAEPRADFRLSLWKENAWRGLPPRTPAQERYRAWVSTDGWVLFSTHVKRASRLILLDAPLFFHLDSKGMIAEVVRARDAVGDGRRWFLREGQWLFSPWLSEKSEAGNWLSAGPIEPFRTDPPDRQLTLDRLVAAALRKPHTAATDRGLAIRQLTGRLGSVLLVLVMPFLIYWARPGAFTGQGTLRKVLFFLAAALLATAAHALVRGLGEIGLIGPAMGGFSVPAFLLLISISLAVERNERL